MAVAGPAFPTTATTAAESPWLDNDWTSPGAVVADDGTAASCTAASFDTPDQTYVLKATGFNFSAIPDGSTINGITCRVNAWYAAGQGAGSLDLCQLLNASAARVGTNQCAVPVALTTNTATIITKGGATDLWGNALTAAWVKDPDFGVALGVLATAANADVFIDYVTLEVNYTAPVVPNAGAAAGVMTRAGVAIGARVSSGSASGAVSRVGAATGASVHSGSVSGSVARAGSAAGVAPVSVKQGSASGSVSWIGSATGARQAAGTAFGTITYAGSAIGARTPTGAAVGGLTYTSSATGTRTSAGSIAGALVWSGAATGAAPTVGVPSGLADGTITWTGSATGTAPNGAARWRLVRHGSWDYATLGFIADSGAILIGDQPDAHWVPAEDQSAAEDVNRYSYRIDLAR